MRCELRFAPPNQGILDLVESNCTRAQFRKGGVLELLLINTRRSVQYMHLLILHCFRLELHVYTANRAAASVRRTMLASKSGLRATKQIYSRVGVEGNDTVRGESLLKMPA